MWSARACCQTTKPFYSHADMPSASSPPRRSTPKTPLLIIDRPDDACLLARCLLTRAHQRFVGSARKKRGSTTMDEGTLRVDGVSAWLDAGGASSRVCTLGVNNDNVHRWHTAAQRPAEQRISVAWKWLWLESANWKDCNYFVGLRNTVR